MSEKIIAVQMTNGELFWNTFEQHAADEQRTTVERWEDVPAWQKPSIEYATSAVIQRAIAAKDAEIARLRDGIADLHAALNNGGGN